VLLLQGLNAIDPAGSSAGESGAVAQAVLSYLPAPKHTRSARVEDHLAL